MDGFNTDVELNLDDLFSEDKNESIQNQSETPTVSVGELDSEPEITNSSQDTQKEGGTSDEGEAETIQTTTKSAGGSLAGAHKAILDKRTQLLNSRVKHFGIPFPDGSLMRTFKGAIRTLNSTMSVPVPQKEEDFTSALGTIRSNYRSLVESANNYVNYIESKKKGKSPSGQIRLRLAKEILAQSRKELTVFEMPSKTLFAQIESEASWDGFLYNARAERIAEGDTSITKIGAGTSTIYRKEEEDGSTRYIKAEERIGQNELLPTYIEMYEASGLEGAKEMAQKIMVCYNQAAERDKDKGYDQETAYELNEVNKMFMKLMSVANETAVDRQKGESDKEYNDREKSAIDAAMEKQIQAYYNQPFFTAADYVQEHYDTFIEMILYVGKKMNEFDTATTSAKIDEGETISNRNVSTSRMAEKYGISDMVAKSETVLIEDEKGNVKRANSMEGIEGKSMGELMIFAQAEGIKLTLSPDAIRQLYELQVFDLICGQVDRHPGNYIPTYEVTGEKEYTITALKAIDNDMSFGGGLTKITGVNEQKGLIDRRGKVSIPYLPRTFYNRIMAYTSDMATYDQMDIRSQKEIDALGVRITQMQKQLQDLVAQGKITLLDSDKDWVDAKQHIIDLQKEGKLGTSYLPVELL